jgi:hypothetical protein
MQQMRRLRRELRSRSCCRRVAESLRILLPKPLPPLNLEGILDRHRIFGNVAELEAYSPTNEIERFGDVVVGWK